MKKIVIATTTWYKNLNEVRAQLALKTIQEAKKCGHQIVIVDNSSYSVKKAFQEQGAIVFHQKEKGIGPSRRQVFREAVKISGPETIIAWIEPEKHSFVPLLGTLAKILENNSADLLIPRRKSLKSYPLVQQHFEWLNNYAFQVLAGINFDHCTGVRIFKSEIAHYFWEYKGEYGDKWDVLLIPIVRLLKDGKKIIEFKVDFQYPKEQKAEEEIGVAIFKKRLDQLINCFQALKQECSF